MKQRNQALRYGIGASLMALAASANAALPTYASDLFTQLTTYATDALAAMAALGVITFGGFWLWSIVKKGANKAK